MNDQRAILIQSQWIAAALLMGCVLFGGTILFLFSQGWELGDTSVPILDTVAAIVGGASVPMAFFIRAQIWSKRAGLEGGARDNVFRSGVIVFMAVLEGAILLNLVAWMVNGDAVPPAVIAAILLAIGALSFPREHHMEVL